jgi:hypothetical protein
MACVLTTGFDYECNNGAGGVKQGSLLITDWDNIVVSTSVVAAGEITTLSMVGGTSFKRYKIRKEIVAMDSTSTTDPLTGSNVNEAVITAALYKLSKTKNTELKLAQGTPLCIIIQDNNDTYHCYGFTNGAELLTVQAMTGKALSEMNGYNLSFTSKEQNRYTVASSVMATILVEGENS